jgi:L-ascorbate metabolism protein UlaG (beta-lactamase superfamily)
MNIPMHYDTFDWIRAEPQRFVDGVQAAGRRARIVRPGQSCTLD